MNASVVLENLFGLGVGTVRRRLDLGDGKIALSSGATRGMSDLNVEALIEEYLLRHAEGAAETAEAFCGAHPEHAAVLRRRLVHLDRLNLLGSASPSASRIVPESFDGFEVVRELGHGGMGVVYEARQIALNRRVAIKVMAGGAALSPQTRARFEREITTLARISHPSIVKVFGSGSVRGAPYVAMELVEGESLAKRLPRRGERIPRETVEARVRTAVVLARALDHAHERGVVHRDVKPGNVLLARDGSPVLLDFGLARDVQHESMTESGEFVGTLAYTAPEQARGERVDRRADVYGLGATLYHLLTGSPPYDARTITDLAQLFTAGPPGSASRLNPALPRDLVTVIDYAIAPNALRRYASCADFADDLEAVLAGRPIRAKRVGAIGRTVRWVRRRPATALALVVTAIAVVLGGVLFNKSLEDLHRARQQQLVDDAREHGQMLDRSRTALFGSRNQAASGLLEQICARWPDDLDAWELRLEAVLKPHNSSRRARLLSTSLKPQEARIVFAQVPPPLRREPSGVLFGRILDELDRGGDVFATTWNPGALGAAESGAETLRLASVFGRVLGRIDDALRLVEPLIDESTPNFAADLLLASLLRDRKDLFGYAAAVRAQIQRPTEASPVALLALSTLERARLTPSDAEGRSEFDTAELPRVWRLFEHALDLEPDNPAILQQYGYAIAEARLPGWEAYSEALLRRAFQLEPSSAVGRFSLAFVIKVPSSTSAPDPREVLDLLEPIEAEYGQSFDYWRDVAFFRSKLEGPPAAIEVLQRGLDQIAPEDAYRLQSLLLEYRADIKSDSVNTSAAIAEWDELWNCAPDDGDGMEALLMGLATIRDEPRRSMWLERCRDLQARGVKLGPQTLQKLTGVWKDIK